MGISPAACSSLFVPLIQHAIRNKKLTEMTTTYCNILAAIFTYASEDTANTTHLFRDIIDAIKSEEHTHAHT